MQRSNPGQKIPYDNKNELLEYLMRRFGDKVMHLAFSYLGNRDEAEDAAQEVFLKVYTSLEKFQRESSPFTWIYAITVNLCRDRLKKKQFFKWEPLTENNLAAGQMDPEQRVMRSIEEQTLIEGILELPIAYREIIVLHYLNELSVKEVADVTRTTVSLVKVHLFRGRKKLQKILEGRGVHYGS